MLYPGLEPDLSLFIDHFAISFPEKKECYLKSRGCLNVHRKLSFLEGTGAIGNIGFNFFFFFLTQEVLYSKFSKSGSKVSFFKIMVNKYIV